MSDLTHFSLFSGIGGIDLAATWAGFTTVGFCEIDPFCQQVLRKHWPGVPIWGDVRDVTAESVRAAGIGAVDLVSGGFPCQPYSCAGKRRGKEDDRALWPQMFRVIKELRPTWVLGENVHNFVNLGLDDALSDLESAGYEVQAFVVPACAVGAPHKRDRVFIVGYSESQQDNIRRECGETGKWASDSERREKHIWNEFGRPSQDVAYTEGNRCGSRRTEPTGQQGEICSAGGCSSCYVADTQRKPVGTGLCSCEQTGERRGRSSNGSSEDDVPYANSRGGIMRGNRELSATSEAERSESYFRGGTPQYEPGEWWAVEPDVGRVASGVPSRVDRLKSLGNAVVPQQVYPILAAIAEIERQVRAEEEGGGIRW